MPCRLLYYHPVTNNRWYFRDFREMPDGSLKPVGYQRFRMRLSTIFETELEAESTIDYLVSLGYKVSLISVWR